MKVIEVRQESELLNLRERWDQLLARSASGAIFLTWEWISAWWAAYGTPGELCILLAVDDRDTLQGIAPLRRRTVRKYGQTYSTLAFVGDGSADSDYLDCIIAEGEEEAVMGAFGRYWESELSQGTLLELNEIPDSSPNLRFLRALGRRRGMIWSEEAVACATVALPGNWDAYLKTLAPRFRTKIRSALRNLESRAEVRFEFCRQPEQLDRWLSSLFELHRRRWAAAAKPGVFRWDRKRLFYQQLSPLVLDRGWLCFSALEWKGQILSCQYGFVYRSRYFQLQEGFDPACEHWNVGIGLRAWSIRELLQQGVAEYDFLGGVGRHKSDWGARTKLSQRVVLGRLQARNLLFCRGPEWAGRARQAVKSYVPDRLLAARDAYQERRRAAEFQRRETRTPDANLGAPWVRSTLAACYFHSPFPWLLPRLRDRYRLRVSPNGRWPRIRLDRRRQPSARILYFHRVNEEGDPFLGSISTRLFEQEMRFVARHYRVVSLAEAARRLAHGEPAEPVVAITFDDGYQDNYLNAFPVLQRYGLPATIFLTTGSLDSRERLWFEQLSLAVKRTSRAYIDLEIDVPRRLWTRTEAERLAAKDQIIALVRGLPDAERRRWVSEILAYLDAPRDREDTMLTWDQVRFMNQRGIDFGGHTVTHPFISRLSPEQVLWEVSECKRRIEEELQVPVHHFAYPNGRDGDFEEWNKQVLKDAGYRVAASTLWGVNYPGTDPMELRRGQPWEEDAAVFAAKLDWYQWGDV